jgi:hypothetical protein
MLGFAKYKNGIALWHFLKSNAQIFMDYFLFNKIKLGKIIGNKNNKYNIVYI